MKVTIDGNVIEAEGQKTILDLAREKGIFIPSLCDHAELTPFTGCRLCLVEIEGRRGYSPACATAVGDGMVVRTTTPELNELRREILELILSEHPNACLVCTEKENCDEYKSTIRKVSEVTGCVLCSNNRRCELQDVVEALKIEKVRFPSVYRDFEIKREDPFFDRNYNLCILCGRCIRVDQEILGFEAIAFNLRGAETYIGGAFGKPLIESGCTFCGSCIEVCPTGALMDRGEEWNRWTERESLSIRCKYNCPARVDVPRFIRFIREKKYAEAVAVIRESVPFAAACSLICEHPCEAEGACRRGDLDQPVAIRALERFAVERSSMYEPSEGLKAAPSGKKIAIVGSGPAGLTAAYYLAKKGGHTVTVFESLSQPGGMMRAQIPDYILPRDILDAEIEGLSKLGVKIKTESKVVSVDKLFEKGFDAVLLATGVTAELDKFSGEIGKKTGRKGVFTCGNAVSGMISFIEAVAAGRQAAVSIDRYLGGTGIMGESLAPMIEGVPRVGRIDSFAQRRRQEMPAAKPAKPVGNFSQVELGFSDELGQEEAKRCMGCDLRFAVARMVAGPEGKFAKTLARS